MNQERVEEALLQAMAARGFLRDLQTTANLLALEPDTPLKRNLYALLDGIAFHHDLEKLIELLGLYSGKPDIERSVTVTAELKQGSDPVKQGSDPIELFTPADRELWGM